MLKIGDNGCGFQFDPNKSLLTLRQRASSLGGELSVVTALGAGTSLLLSFPLIRSSL